MKRLLTCIFLLILPAMFSCEHNGNNANGQDSPQYDAIFFGDSITANWVKESRGHPAFFDDNNFLCLGFSGKTTAYMKSIFKAVTDKRPRQLVILGGTNDIAMNDGVYVSAGEIRDNIAWMASEASGLGIRVILCSVLPSRYFSWATSVHPENLIVELNTLLKALSDENGYAYADYHSALSDSENGLSSQYTNDGCHPNKDGYTVMEGIILPILKSEL